MIGIYSSFQKRREALPGADLARRPGPREPARPVGRRRPEPPVGEIVAVDRRRRRRQTRGGGEGRARRRPGEKRPPERREDTERAAVLGEETMRLVEQVRVETRRRPAPRPDLGLERRVDRPFRPADAPVPEDRVGAALRHDRRHDDLRRPAAQHQPSAARGDARGERGEGVVQPPARRRAERAQAGRDLVEDMEEDDRPPRPRRRVEGGIVGEPQVVAQPDENGSSGHAKPLRADRVGEQRP